jgi:hypothetical protein
MCSYKLQFSFILNLVKKILKLSISVTESFKYTTLFTLTILFVFIFTFLNCDVINLITIKLIHSLNKHYPFGTVF